MTSNCPACMSSLVHFANVCVRMNHQATLSRCSQCGFITYDDVKWLSEAYASPINPSDVGYIHRNVLFSCMLDDLLRSSDTQHGYFLDYGSGYGMFVRLMRDRGYRFHSLDPYCQNLFALNTEANAKKFGPYSLITAFEVFEHLADPQSALQEMLQFGDTLLFSTDLVPDPVPSPDTWDYFGLEHGQHVSLWTESALTSIASQFKLKYTNLKWVSTSWHLFAPNSHRLHLPPNKPLSRLFQRFRPQKVNLPSLMMTDYKKVVSYEKQKLSGDTAICYCHLDDH